MKCDHPIDRRCSKCRPDIFKPTREQAIEHSTKYLTERISQAKEAYYSGKPIITDQQYDALEDSLRAINPDAKILNKVGFRNKA